MVPGHGPRHVNLVRTSNYEGHWPKSDLCHLQWGYATGNISRPQGHSLFMDKEVGTH